MTKEETLDMIIDDYKNGSQSAMEDYCNGTRCDECPFDFNDCMNDVACTLIERLIKAEEKKETNLEHYIIRDKGVAVNFHNEHEAWRLIFKVGADDACYESRNRFNAIDWLLEPYKPPKFKLTQFGYDLLDFCKQYNDELVIEDWAVLKDMHDKGHYKGIPTDVPIKDILDNCEEVTRMRLIDADAITYELWTTEVDGNRDNYRYFQNRYMVDRRAIESMPTVEERPKGEWIFNPTDAIDLMFAKPKCSECGFESSDGGNFCSSCGADMRGG